MRPRGEALQGHALRRFRHEQGITQYALAELFEIWLEESIPSERSDRDLVPRWQEYGLRQPAISDRFLANVERRGRASSGYARALRDFLSDRFELPSDFLAPSTSHELSSLHQIPSSPADFVGRDAELKQLNEALENGARIVAVHGMGGVGKTALALVFAERLTDDYPDAQLYLDLRGAHQQEPLTPGEAMRHVIRSFAPASQLPDEETALTALYRSVLHGKRALLLLDNARDADQVEGLLPPAGCATLVTSRQRFALPGLVTIELDSLPQQDAQSLLLSISPSVGDCGPDLARLCGHLPLALRLAASVLATREDLSPQEFLVRLRQGSERLQLVKTSAELSYELLVDSQRRFWRTLAVFPGTFDRSAVASVLGIDESLASEHLGSLLRYSLLTWDSSAMRYRLHDLLRLVADSLLSDRERGEAGRRHSVYYYREVLRRSNELCREGGDSVLKGLQLFDLERQNIDCGFRWAQRNDDGLCSSYSRSGELVLTLRYDAHLRLEWCQAALSASRRIEDRSAEAGHLNNLGLAYNSLGEYRKAIECQEQSLFRAREQGDQRGLAKSLNNLGVAYNSLGEYRKAIECQEQSLALKRELGDLRGEASSLGNLGFAYRSLGDHRKAVELYQESLSLARELGDRWREATSLNSMADALKELGLEDEAKANMEAALRLCRTLGVDQVDEATRILADWRGEDSSTGPEESTNETAPTQS